MMRINNPLLLWVAGGLGFGVELLQDFDRCIECCPRGQERFVCDMVHITNDEQAVEVYEDTQSDQQPKRDVFRRHSLFPV